MLLFRCHLRFLRTYHKLLHFIKAVFSHTKTRFEKLFIVLLCNQFIGVHIEELMASR